MRILNKTMEGIEMKRIETEIGIPAKIDEPELTDENNKPIYQGRVPIIRIGEHDKALDNLEGKPVIKVIYGLLTARVIYPESAYLFPLSRGEDFETAIHKKYLKQPPVIVEKGEERFRREIYREHGGFDLIDIVDFIPYGDKVLESHLDALRYIGARFAQVIHRERMRTDKAIVLNGRMRKRDFGPYTCANMPGERIYRLNRPLEEQLEQAFLEGLRTAQYQLK